MGTGRVRQGRNPGCKVEPWGILGPMRSLVLSWSERGGAIKIRCLQCPAGWLEGAGKVGLHSSSLTPRGGTHLEFLAQASPLSSAFSAWDLWPVTSCAHV